MKRLIAVLPAILLLQACTPEQQEDQASIKACVETLTRRLRSVAADRADRFEGKVDLADAVCRGGQNAAKWLGLPWVDWGNYYGTGDASSKPPGVILNSGLLSPSGRGVAGALLDLEYQRIELIKFNLFDNNGTYQEYVLGRKNAAGPTLKIWPSMRLPKDHPNYQDVGGDAPQQVCTSDLIRKRTLTGICNDILNPLMGSTGQLFARNVEFDTTFPDLGANTLTRNRHGDRLSLLEPDPQVISRAPVHPRAGPSRNLPPGLRRRRSRHVQLRLPDRSVLQRAGRVLDSVHDA